MKRCHHMPFGAELQADGRVRFQIWAPGARQVDLCLEQTMAGTIIVPMIARGEGWYSLVSEQADAGSYYRYRIDGELLVPDPVSRFQAKDVHGPSQVINPESWPWHDSNWRGRRWQDAVIYELHVGAFSVNGRFAAVKDRLDYLIDLGITAIELMPVADFPGLRNWGYDGVLLFAPDSRYGAPDELKDLIQCAHQKGLMVFLDVVYNHFGPEGNYLPSYAPQFFSERHHTPWGAAINFDGPGSETVRQYFIHNALYWLEEYHLDGLRLDAVHAIVDDSSPDILQELAAAVLAGPGRDRYVHLMLENEHNAAHYLQRDQNKRPQQYVAQWNDDIHHALHSLLTAEADGYYADYAKRPVWYLGRCLAEGFGYQGEASAYRAGATRGEPSRSLPPAAFISFLQNHDQVGNRAFGERISTLVGMEPLQAALAVILLAPSPPLLFMGEEFAARAPFQFFCDFGADLAESVTQGRRREFARFARFADAAVRESIPDPNAESTFAGSKLDWESMQQPSHQAWLAFYRQLLRIRQTEIIPRLLNMPEAAATFEQFGETGLRVRWPLGDGSVLSLLANLGEATLAYPYTDKQEAWPLGISLYTHPQEVSDELDAKRLAPWAVAWFLRSDAS